MGSVGRKVERKSNTEYTKGGTTYSITEKNGKPYLKLTTGSLVNSYRIAYAKNPEKAQITVPYVGVIKFSSDKNIQSLLENYNKNK